MADKRRGAEKKRVLQRRERRESFAKVTPRSVKRDLGATTTSQTPLHIRALGLDLPDVERAHARERVSFKLGKFGLAITRISVRFEDVAGPKGAPVVECRFKIVLRNAADVTVAAEGATPRAAFDRAVGSAERTVRRTLEKGQQARQSARAG